MRYAYPCVLHPEEPSGFYVTFPDVPGALTNGRDRAQALEMAKDALAVALAGYVLEQWDIPVPSPVAEGQELVPVPPVIAAKLALYTAMRSQRVTNAALGKRLGVSETTVRRLVNPNHLSQIGKVEKALEVVGRSLVIEDSAA